MAYNPEQKELLDAIQIMIDNTMASQNTKIYIGIVQDILAKRQCEISVNNRIHKVQYYGEAPTVGQQYRVFVPFNKMSQAFIITGGGESGDTGTFDYTQLTNKPSINSVTLTGNTTSTQLGLYGANNQPPYPVTEVNGQTGEVNLTSVDVGALPDSTIIPTELSQLENDVGFITALESPVQSVNGETGAVVLDAQDVGALPDDTTYVESVNGASGIVTITKSTVGLGNVDNVRQYSSSNPPPYPVVSVNGEVGAVVLDIPTETSDLINDSGFITEADIPVKSVAGKTGVVTLVKGDVGLGNVDNVRQYSATNPPPYPVTSVNGQTGSVALSIPTKTSDLTNDSGFLPVTQTAPVSGQIVAYDGMKWVNQSPQSYSQQQVNWDETDTGSVQYIQNKPTALSQFSNDSGFITTAGAPVQSVNGQTGTVNVTTVTGNAGTATTLATARTIAISGGATGTATSFNGGANITIPVTSLDATKLTGTASISTTGHAATATKATQDGNGAVIATTYAKLASPALTGTPTAPTATSTSNNTRIATTAFVKTAISSIGAGNVTYLSTTAPTSPKSGDIWYKIL